MNIIITWKSGSWKTTISNYLEQNYWYSIPYNYTTRKPREFDEKDYSEYMFVSKEHFKYLWDKGYLINRTEFDWNNYWIWKNTLSLENVIFIVDEFWRKELKEKIPDAITVWVETSDFERRKRLYARWLRWEDLEERLYWKSENMWPSNSCIIVDGTKPVEEIAYSLIGNNKWTE